MGDGADVWTAGWLVGVGKASLSILLQVDNNRINKINRTIGLREICVFDIISFWIYHDFAMRS